MDRRIGFSVGALTLLFGMVAPAVLPAFASAAQLTSRSMLMSTSVASDTANYAITFTPASTTPVDMDILFCDNTPLSGNTCTAPTGFSLSGVTVSGDSATYDATDSSNPGGSSNNEVGLKTVALTSGANTITLTGVTNPSTANHTFYVRIETFDTALHAEAEYTADGASAETGLVDNGSVAAATSSSIGVTAAVLESMTFCVYGDPNNNTGGATPTQGTADASSYLASLTTSADGPGLGCVDNSTSGGGHNNSNASPSTQLGQVNSDVSALSTSTPSYAADWAQLSTNASQGALVYLKTSNQCAGLFRTGESTATDCQIPSVGASSGGSMATGVGGFGLSFGAAVSAGTGSSGTIGINTNYAGGSYAMMDSTSSATTSGDPNGSGLTQDTTSPYGGYVFGSEGNPVSSQDVPFALAGSISNNTPAGNYSANLDLISVGKF